MSIILRPENEDKDNGMDRDKCQFYSDNVCRKEPIADRDCLRCLQNRYSSLYSFNWKIQDDLNKKIAQKEQECEILTQENQEAKEIIAELETRIETAEENFKKISETLIGERDMLKAFELTKQALKELKDGE